MKQELIQLRISKELKDSLTKKAKENSMSNSEAIRYLIQKWVKL